MIHYITTLENVEEQDLNGFFVGWPNPPNTKTFRKLLSNSDEIILAVDSETNQVVGFINAITDKTLMAFIPLLEVLPSHQGKGIGGVLVKKMFDQLRDFYAIDLFCDQDLQSYYKKFGMSTSTGMVYRNYDKQSGH